MQLFCFVSFAAINQSSPYELVRPTEVIVQGRCA